MSTVRCGIYTRKSSDEGLEQSFNSLDAQREACAAYIQSQRHGGWQVVSARYDDGGLSGGSLDRPALQQLLNDVDAGRIDMIVVYKIDRLTRSLSDFAKLVDRLDRAGASFVSVTQQFNTSTSMGRLTLNVLLSFAQFEREVTAERIRDKIAASKQKGLWMGGRVPLGYDKSADGLVINEAEAETVRALFAAYLDLGCVRRLKAFADAKELRTKTRAARSGSMVPGKPFSRGRLYHLLSNPVYVGQVRHKSNVYDGRHDAIVDLATWDRVQDRLQQNAVRRRSHTNAASPSPLAGKIFDKAGQALTPSHATKNGRRYRYYVSKSLIQESGHVGGKGWRLPATEVESAVISAIRTNRECALMPALTDAAAIDGQELLTSVERVEVLDTELHITVGAASAAEHRKPQRIVAPYTLRRRGVEQKIVLEGDASRAPDLVLIRRIVRAIEWADDIKKGSSIAKIAAREGIAPEFITHNIDLAFLSPRVLTAVAEGRQRADISASSLAKIQLPANWDRQEQLLIQ